MIELDAVTKRLDRPTSGDIRVDGESIAQMSDDARTRVRRDKIGFIFQFFNLLPTLTCLENVGLPLVYVVWIAVLLMLYPLASWFARVKRERRDWWLSYI